MNLLDKDYNELNLTTVTNMGIYIFVYVCCVCVYVCSLSVLKQDCQ